MNDKPTLADATTAPQKTDYSRMSLYDIAAMGIQAPPLTNHIQDNKTAADAANVQQENTQGFGGDAVDAFQKGAFDAAAGAAETVNLITGSEAAGKFRDAANNRSKDQIDQMSQAGQEAMGKQFFSEDEYGRTQFGEAWTDPRAFGLQVSALAGQIVPQVVGGLGIGSLGAKVGGNIIFKSAAKQAAARGLAAEEAAIYAKGVTSAAFGTGGQAIAEAGIAGGMMGVQAREEVLGMSSKDQDESNEFRKIYRALSQQNPNESVDNLRKMSAKTLADRVARAVETDPALVTSNLVLGAVGGRFIDNMLRGVGTGSRLTNAAQQAVVQGGTEGVQGGLEQNTLNRAMIDEGADSDRNPMQGVISSALNEGIMGGALGGAMGGIQKGAPRERLPEGQQPINAVQADENGRVMNPVKQGPSINPQSSVDLAPSMSLDDAVSQIKAERGQYKGIDDDIRIAEQQGFTDEAVRLRSAKRNYEVAADLIAEGDIASAERFRERGNKIYRDVMEVTDPQYKGGFPAEYVAVGEMVERAGQFPAPVQPQGETVDGQATRVVPPTPALQHSTKGIPASVDAPYYMPVTPEEQAQREAAELKRSTSRQMTDDAFTEQQGAQPPVRQPLPVVEELPGELQEIELGDTQPPLVDVEETDLAPPIDVEEIDLIPYQKPAMPVASDTDIQVDTYDQDGYISFQPSSRGAYDPTLPPATDTEMEQDLQRLEQAAKPDEQSENPTSIQAENGRKGRVKIGDKYEPVTFQLVDLAKNLQLAPTMAQDENQPRDRKRFSSNQQINKIAKELDFNELGESPRMSGGAPTITNDGKIIGGNGRTAAVRQAYANGTAENYRNELKARAREFGLTPAQIDAMEQPVLVRRLQNPVDVVKAAIQSNDSGTMNMSPLEQVRADSKLFGRTPAIELDDNGAINWNSPNNQPALKGFIAAIPQNEQNSMLDGRGFATPEAKNRFARMLMYRAFGNSRVLSNLIEDTSESSRNLLAALKSVSPRIAVINQQMAEGTLHRIDLSDYIVEAVELLESLRLSSRSVTDYINQLDMVSVTSPATNAIAAQLEENIRSRNALLNQLNGYYDAIVAAGHPDQGNLFGATVPALEEITGANRYARPEASQSEGARRPGPGVERTPAPAEAQISADSGFTGAEPQAASADSGAEVDLLTPYSEQDLAQREAEQAEAASKEAAQQKAAEQKARADSEALDFTLSGSDRPADIAESRGQNSLFDTGGEPAPQDNEPTQTTANAGVSVSGLPEILTTPRKAYLKKMASAQGVKRNSPGYDAAMAKIEENYESAIDEAQASLTFEQFNKLNSETSESLNRQAWESLREEYGIDSADVVRNTVGNPFKTVQAARAALKKNPGYEVSPTDGGFELTRIPEGSAVARNGNMAKPTKSSATDINDDFGPDMNDEPTPEPPKPTAKKQTKLDNAVDSLSKLKAEKARKLADLIKKRGGQMNSGIDPELMIAVAELGAVTIAEGTVRFARWARDILNTMRSIGIEDSEVKPFLKEAYGAISSNPEKYGISDDIADEMDSPREIRKINIDTDIFDGEGDQDAVYPAGDTDQNSEDRTNAVEGIEPNIPNDRPGGGGSRANEAGEKSDSGQQADASVDIGSTTTDRERSNKPVPVKKSGLEPSPAGDTDHPRSDSAGTGRLFAEHSRPKQVGQSARKTTEVTKKTSGRLQKINGPVKPSDADQISQQMPFLDKGQVGDIEFIEKRLSRDDGYGVLLTNGTGTGKTFSGLGTIRRSIDNGKGNVLIVTPSKSINNAWMKAASSFFDINVNELKDTKDAGDGVVVTTFANFGNNGALFNRNWDLIVLDEAHKLSQNEAGDGTAALLNLRGLAMKEGSQATRAKGLNPELYAEIKDLEDTIEANRNSDDERNWQANTALEEKLSKLNDEFYEKVAEQKKLIESTKPKEAPRALMLSATPFSYEKSVQIGQGFLFDWRSKNKDSNGGYNSGSDYDKFMMEHFGYRMKYNKLTQPDANVDRDLMQRNFNSWLKSEGVLRGRVLETDYDYDRKFLLAESAIGRRVDAAIKWLRESDDDNAPALRDIILGKQFDYHARMYLLEAIKAKESVPVIKKHLALGRKVLIMHGFKKGGAFNPFRVDSSKLTQQESALYQAFSNEFDDLIQSFGGLPSAIGTLKSAFPDLMVYNGDVSSKNRLEMQKTFNDDSSNAPLLAQGAAMREGVSIHDTTGNRQRVLIHLGMPGEPAATIQQEGRIYRVGQASDAIFRYFTIDTSWERFAFASRIAERASAAENLAMGEDARGLKEAFIEAYEQAGDYEPGHDGEGTGGKSSDRSKAQQLTNWDKAKAYYFGTKKQGKGRSSAGREGNDYFATPEPVGLKMVELAKVKGGEKILEPSAGHGAIGRWFPENTEAKAIEPSDELASKLSLRFKGEVLTGMFEDHHIVNKYDAIVMNPPYGSGGKLAADHVRKAMVHLRDGGRIVALIPTGPAADKQFSKLLESEDAKGIYQVADIKMPRSTFERAGTSVATRIIVLERQNDPDTAAKLETVTRDYSQDSSINELFDSIENLDIPDRLVSEAKSAVTTSIDNIGVQVHKMDSKHTKTDEPLFVVNLDGDMGDNYEKMNAIAKENDGYYIKARMRSYYNPSDGVPVSGKPTFTFKTSEGREKFIAAIGGIKSEEPALASLRKDDIKSRLESLASQKQGETVRLSEAKDVKRWIRDTESQLGTKINVIQTRFELPLNLGVDLALDPSFSFMDGIYDPKTNETYIIADRIHDRHHAIRVALHEALGHGGVISFLKKNESAGGKKYLEELDNIYRLAGEKAIFDEIDNYNLDPAIEDERRVAVLEYIAHIAERGVKMGLVRRAVAAIRDFIRTLFPNIGWNETDTLSLIEKGRRHVQSTANNGNVDAGDPGVLKRLSDTLENDNSLSDSQKEFLGKIAPKSISESAVDRFKEVTNNWRLKVRQGLADRYAAFLEMDKQLLDGNVTSEENITKSSWVRARMSNAASGAVSAMMNAGRIFMSRDGVIDVKENTNGLVYTLNKLGSAAEVEKFMGWIAANRAEKLMGEGRENLFTPSEIEAGKTLNQGVMRDGRNRNEVYNKVFEEFQEYRDDILSIAEKAGVITAENREMWANEFYVPFYRLDDDNNDSTGPRVMGGLSRQQAYKKLKGGTQNLNDLLQNTIMNFHHLVDASLKNMAATQAVDSALQLDVAEVTTEAARDKKQSTFVLRGGEKVWYDIGDPLVFQALTSLNHTGMNSAAMSAMRWFKRTFTNLTTSTPQFVVANLIRDSLSAIAVTDMNKNAISNVASGIKSFGVLDRTGYERARLMASGGAFSFGHVYGEDADSIKYQIDGELRRAKIVSDPRELLKLGLKPIKATWDKWQDVNNAFENVNRAAAFKQAEEAGKGTLYAAFQARDLMDFSAIGAWPAVRFLVDVVPFLNARLQGLDKLYRSGIKPSAKVVMQMLGVGNIEASVSERKAAARFSAVVGALSAATMALFLHNQDDEDYKKAPDWLKDSYWWFRIPNSTHIIKIPKPFEVGAIATVTERLLEQAVSDEATGELFAERMKHMLTGTFAFSAVPQMFQPMLDVYANKDSFTGRDIETMGQQRLSPSNRSSSGTTSGAKALSKISTGVFGEDSNYALSPVQVDHLIGGYFGQVGSWAVGTIDVLKNTLSDNAMPAKAWSEFQPFRRFYQDAGKPMYNKNTEIFYEALRESARLNADLKMYRQEGEMARADEFQYENSPLLNQRLKLNRINSKLQDIRARIKGVESNSNLSAEEKRRRIDLLKIRQQQLVDRVIPAIKAANASM